MPRSGHDFLKNCTLYKKNVLINILTMRQYLFLALKMRSGTKNTPPFSMNAKVLYRMGSRSVLFSEVPFFIQSKLNFTDRTGRNNLRGEVVCAGWIIEGGWGQTYFFDDCPQHAWHPEGGSINTVD